LVYGGNGLTVEGRLLEAGNLEVVCDVEFHPLPVDFLEVTAGDDS
jgi:hypothetical protein